MQGLFGKRVLVTGKFGSIGSRLCGCPSEARRKVRCIDNFDTGQRGKIADRGTLLRQSDIIIV